MGFREDNDHDTTVYLNCSGGCERLLSPRHNAEWVLISFALESELQLNGVTRICRSNLLSSPTASLSFQASVVVASKLISRINILLFF